MQTLFFADSSTLFNVVFMVLGSQNPPKIIQNRSEKLLGHRVGRKSEPKVTWEAPGDQKRDLQGCLEPFGPQKGRRGTVIQAPLGYSWTAGEG